MPTTTTPNPQAHIVVPDATTAPCAELARAISDVHDRLTQIDDAIAEATRRRDAYDKEAGQWHDLEHEAQKSAIADIEHKPAFGAKALGRWQEKYDVDEAAVRQAHDEEARLTKLADDEQHKIEQLHDEQARLRRWLVEAEYQVRTRCPQEMASAARPYPLVARVAAGAAAAAMVFTVGIVLRPSTKPEPADRPVVAAVPDAPVATEGLALVSGSYAGSITVVEDPAGHKCCVRPNARWEVLQQRNTNTGEITLAVANVLPGIRLAGPIAATGEKFSLSTVGRVAGYDDVQVTLNGAVTPDGHLLALLLVGGNRALPQGKLIAFEVNLTKTTHLSSTRV